MGKKIDLTKMSAHVLIDRADRVRYIENTVGWGSIIVEAPDKNKENVHRVLTSTGVMIIKAEDGFMITTWIADVGQAKDVWKKAKGDKPMPRWLWNVVNYNNNTAYWKNLVAA